MRSELVSIRHFFTVDVEEYFQVAALAPWAPRTRWESFESRVELQVDRLLELLGRYDAHGTFFTVGCVAERHPSMIRAIVSAGHELAGHTWDHRRVTGQTPDEFRESIRRTKQTLEDLGGTPVIGFRAPSFSILRGTEWSLDVLIEEGYRYDSSLFPVRRRGYGYVGGRRDPYWIDRPAGRLAEIPPATLQIGWMTLPAAGGAYFRLLPYALVRSALRSAESRSVPATFYIHPWEYDPEQPRLPVSFLTGLRHYAKLGGVWPRLERLLGEFRFTAIVEGLNRELSARSPARGSRRHSPERSQLNVAPDHHADSPLG
jgi:polysaccharide deacetylase family protein (PEP-CTERM system associated)